MNFEPKINSETRTKRINKSKIINHVEAKYYQTRESDIQPGDILQIGYKIQEGEKERLQFSQGLVIAKKNRSISKTFTIRRSVQGVGVEQIFFFHSPLIESVMRKQQSKVRRSKLYFIRELRGKSARLKAK